MKNILLLFIFFIISPPLLSQNITFFNEDWQITKKEKARYYRKITNVKSNTLYQIKDYYISDSIQMKGLFHDDKAIYGEGLVSWYFENGNIKQEIFYENWHPTGKSKIYFENGSIKEIRNYLAPTETFKYAIQESYSETGDTLVYRGNGNYSSFVDNGNFKIEGELKFGFRIGKWQAWKKNGAPHYTEYYNDQGRFIEGKAFDSAQNEYYYNDISVPAKYYKGDEGLYKKISKKINYPKTALKSRIEGVIYLQIDIDETGEITEIKVLKGISKACNAEALRVLRKCDKWLPGIQRGQKIKTTTIIPIRFKI